MNSSKLRCLLDSVKHLGLQVQDAPKTKHPDAALFWIISRIQKKLQIRCQRQKGPDLELVGGFDHIDIEDARKALEEPGENISAEKLWKALGL